VDLARELERLLRRPVRAANDADVQGFGVVRGRGVELVVTLGTGFGSALFVDGRLVPNVQLAHHRGWKSKTFEEELGARALAKAGRKKWNRRIVRMIRDLETVFWFDALYIGGGNSARVRFARRPPKVHLVENVAGLLGGLALWRD
jgi:polyphosphate glucokinase